MAIDLAINDGLLEDARRLGGYNSQRDAVHAALEEFVQRRRRVEDVIKLFGDVEFDENYDYKQLRNR